MIFPSDTNGNSGDIQANSIRLTTHDSNLLVEIKENKIAPEQYAAIIRSFSYILSVLRYESLGRKTDGALCNELAGRIDPVLEKLLWQVDQLFDARIGDIPHYLKKVYDIVEKLRLHSVKFASLLALAYRVCLDFLFQLARTFQENSSIFPLSAKIRVHRFPLQHNCVMDELNWSAKVIAEFDISSDEKQVLQGIIHEMQMELKKALDNLSSFAANQTYILTVLSLNPECGTHPIPQDNRELSASLLAGNKCLQEFPYLENRFGRRGKRFTYSDSAWLTSLVDKSQEFVYAQVDWLGSMLSARGIPQLVLERQLFYLYAELNQVLPERNGDYIKLLNAAYYLRNNFLKILSKEQLKRLKEQFSHKLNEKIIYDYRDCPDLLISALVDEAMGIENASSSLLDYYLDKRRNPRDIIDAVSRLVHETRQLVLEKNGN